MASREQNFPNLPNHSSLFSSLMASLRGSALCLRSRSSGVLVGDGNGFQNFPTLGVHWIADPVRFLSPYRSIIFLLILLVGGAVLVSASKLGLEGTIDVLGSRWLEDFELIQISLLGAVVWRPGLRRFRCVWGGLGTVVVHGGALVSFVESPDLWPEFLGEERFVFSLIILTGVLVLLVGTDLVSVVIVKLASAVWTAVAMVATSVAVGLLGFAIWAWNFWAIGVLGYWRVEIYLIMADVVNDPVCILEAPNPTMEGVVNSGTEEEDPPVANMD